VKNVQTTNNLGLKKPAAEDVVNIEDLNSNSDVLDGKFGASSGHGHTGAAGDGPKIGSNGLAAGAATDTVIGSRTVSDDTAPTGDSATPTTLFGWLANMIKAITGGATWRTLPGMTIAAIKTILDAATNAGTASTLMKRDANGRSQVAAPSAAADIARKDTVDAVQSSLITHAAVGSAAHGATSAPTVSTMMARDSAGRAQVVAPAVAADIANKGYVDTAMSGATIPDASLTTKGKVQLSSATNSTSEASAATPKAVKDAYDRASTGVTAAAAAQNTANAAQTTANRAAQSRGLAPANLNDAQSPGSYHIATQNLYTNAPPAMPNYCILTVDSAGDGDFLRQTVSSTLNIHGYTYSRVRTESNWSSWFSVWTSGNDQLLIRGRLTTISGSMDFNGYQSPGVYDVVAFSGSNAPPGAVYGILMVYIDQYYLVQEFTQNAPDHNRSYRTRTDSGAWSEWRTMQSHKLTSSDGHVINKSRTNLNYLDLTGFYDGNEFTNAPWGSSGWFYIEVFRHYNAANVYILQRATELETESGLVYERRCLNGTWKEWKPVSGATYVASNTVRAEHLTELGPSMASGYESTFGTLIHKFIPRFTGEINVTFEAKGITYRDDDDNYVYVPTGLRVFVPMMARQFDYDNSGNPMPRYGQGGNLPFFDSRTPVGTRIGGQPGPGMMPIYEGTTVSGNYDGLGGTISVQAGIPIYFFAWTRNPGRPEPRLRNFRLYYDIV
jgi:hypothetical protein